MSACYKWIKHFKNHNQMLTAKFIFITITLILLVLISIKMKVPKSSVPLFIIYLFFVIINFPKTPIKDEKLDSSFVSESKDVNETIYKEKQIVINDNKNNVKPKPLVFDNEKKTRNNIEDNKISSNPQNNQIKENQANENTTLVVKDIMICKSIYKRTPVGSDIVFTSNIDSLYCYTRIQNPGRKREVKHIWYYKNQMMTQVRYNVRKSNIYRSWTKKTILPNQIGNWRVDIQDNNGTIIGSKTFEIKNISDF